MTADDFNRAGVGRLPGYLGVHVLSVNGRELRAELAVRPELMAPNGYLHAGSLITLADTCCGYGCRANLPAGANGCSPSCRETRATLPISCGCRTTA